MLKLTLFSGSECSLCDIAKAMLSQASTTVPVELNIIDVKAQREYYHEYGARIPVLKRHDNQAELGWPFELAELEQFLS